MVKLFAIYQGSLLQGSVFSFTALVRNLAMSAVKAFKAVIVISLQTQSASAESFVDCLRSVYFVPKTR